MVTDEDSMSGKKVSSHEILTILRRVKDPEVPVLDVVEMGIVRGATIEDGRVVVDVTPTYSGCPAMGVIEESIAGTLGDEGIGPVEVRTVLDPPWTTDWMTDEAREKLREYGIAPPGQVEHSNPIQLGTTIRAVECPFCGSADTTLKSAFGSTACKSMHYCNACQQPFEHFKTF